MYERSLDFDTVADRYANDPYDWDVSELGHRVATIWDAQYAGDFTACCIYHPDHENPAVKNCCGQPAIVCRHDCCRDRAADIFHAAAAS